MMTREELMVKMRAICEQTHKNGSGSWAITCEKCGDRWEILEASQNAMWRKYSSGCDRCGNKERDLVISNYEW